jgi:hypothetical protein
MGYDTHYVGHIQVTPPLNNAEFEYLTAFAETPHVAEDPSPYAVSDNPRAPRPVGPKGYSVLNRRDDLPDCICPWIPSCGGRCFVIKDDRGQHHDAAKWLQWIVDHFLKPGALAGVSGDDDFAEFTFDHSLGAAVAAHRSDSGRLWLIRAGEHEVFEDVVWWGQFEY